jgi:hypothetical protein
VLLGRPVFVERAILVNYPARKIVLFPFGVEPPCADPIPLTFVGGAPVVTVTLQATAASHPRHRFIPCPIVSDVLYHAQNRVMTLAAMNGMVKLIISSETK